MSLQDLQDMIADLELRRSRLPTRASDTFVPSRRLETNLTKVQEANCAFDIIGVVLAIARCGTTLYFAQDTCKVQQTPDDKSACGAVLMGLFANIGFLISFASDAAATCAGSLNFPAFCSAAAGNMLAVLSITSSVMASLQTSCRTVTALGPAWRKYLPAAAAKVDAFKDIVRKIRKPRRLRSGEAASPALPAPSPDTLRLLDVPQGRQLAELPANPTQRYLAGDLLQEIRSKLSAAEFRKVEIAACVIDASLLGMFFGRGLLDLYNTAINSPCQKENKVQFTSKVEADATCLVQVTSLITVFDFVGALVALLVSECPKGANVKALCAADVTIAIGAITALIQTGSSTVLLCDIPDADSELVVSDLEGSIAV